MSAVVRSFTWIWEIGPKGAPYRKEVADPGAPGL